MLRQIYSDINLCHWVILYPLCGNWASYVFTRRHNEFDFFPHFDLIGSCQPHSSSSINSQDHFIPVGFIHQASLIDHLSLCWSEEGDEWGRVEMTPRLISEAFHSHLDMGPWMFLKLLWNYKCIHLSTCQDMIVPKDLHRLWYCTFMQNLQKTSDLADAAVASKCAAALTEVVIIPAWECWAYRTSDTVQIIHTAIPREFSQRWKTTEKRREKKRRAKQKRIDLNLPM